MTHNFILCVYMSFYPDSSYFCKVVLILSITVLWLYLIVSHTNMHVWFKEIAVIKFEFSEVLKRPNLRFSFPGLVTRLEVHDTNPYHNLSLVSFSTMEALQELILRTLDSDGSIKDTRQIILPSESQPAVSHDAQLTILGALNSLSSREVSYCNICTNRRYSLKVSDVR